jgi:CubicO group peptidase (beta-lactamase class C family)
MKKFMLLTAIVLSCQLLYPQTGKQVDKYISEQMTKYHIPGLSLAVIKDEQIIYQKGYGFANVELSVPAGAESIYMIGSITKNFTASAVMLLVEEGKIVLDEKITEYLPDVQDVPSSVTVKHLLTHTSGFVDYTTIPGSILFARMDRTPKEVIKPVLALSLNFTPGEKYEYSNTNYILLGMIIERAAKKNYNQFLTERFFQPLNMTATRVNNRVDIIKNRVTGYNWWENKLHNSDYSSPSNSWSSGAIVSDVTDLAKWDIALRTGKVIKPATISLMLTPMKLNSNQEIKYGLGNELINDRNHRVGGHNGEIFGFNTSFSRYVDDNLTVIVLCNLGDVPGEGFARYIAGLYLGLPEINFSGKGIEDKEPGITQMLKDVVLQAGKGEVNAALFTKEAQNDLVPLIKRAGPELMETIGKLKSFILLERKDEAELRTYLYRSVFENNTLIWTFQLTKDNKIVAIEPRPE